tara:strand:+ start:204 stop:1367 length:1164 start_codon:yes stop_codon:yes gene_type:complete
MQKETFLYCPLFAKYMVGGKYRSDVQKILSLADIQINGSRPFDIQVHNPELYERVLSQGSLGLGEAYMDGWWDCKQLDEFVNRVKKVNLQRKIITPKLVYHIVKSKVLNRQTKKLSKAVAKQHYDVGNDLYEHMLDKRMQYTCGYWKDAKNLEQAQEKKLDLICKKLQLKKGDTILELGSGWGWFAKYAVEKYGCKVTAFNISKEQVSYAKKLCKGLPVTFVQQDYREAKGKYDKVVAIGMCEHVGYKNYRNFFKIGHRCLKDGGLFFVHTIGGFKSVVATDPWIEKYIFPNSMLPSVKQLSAASEGLFVMEDWHNFGADYDKTLMAWFENFDKSWPKFEKKYGKRFYRMWKFYLLSCAGSFRSRKNNLWQIVFSKGGVEGCYKSVR